MDLAPAPPVLVTDDEQLLAEVMRLAAAAGVVPLVARDPAAALRAWAGTPLVLVGADLAPALAEALPPRRARVHVVGVRTVPDGLFRDALAVGAESVASLPASEAWLVEQLTDVGDGAGGLGVTLGVMGGSGGAGATVLACALAHCAAVSGAGTLLVDADPFGAGVDRVLGLERRPGVRWDALMQATGRLSARSLRETLPRRERLSVLAWPVDRVARLQAFAVREVLSAGARGFDTVVLDLPRQPDAVVDEVVTRCDHVLLVSTLSIPAVTAASRVARRLATAGVPLHLVTRGRGGVAPAEVSTLLGVPLLAEMSDQRGLDEAVDLGAGPVTARRGSLVRAARRCLAGVAPAGAVAA